MKEIQYGYGSGTVDNITVSGATEISESPGLPQTVYLQSTVGFAVTVRVSTTDNLPLTVQIVVDTH